MLHVDRTVPADSPAMASALAAIDQAFGSGSDIRALKRRCRRVLRAPALECWKARYSRRAAHIAEAVICHRAGSPVPAPSLHIAINIIERQYRTENQALHIARAIGRGNGLSVMVLRELRLLLRFLRAQGMAGEFPKVLVQFAA